MPEKSEVRPCLLRLLLAVGLGVVLMSSAAYYAWTQYGARLAEAPPLPPGKPAMTARP